MVPRCLMQESRPTYLRKADGCKLEGERRVRVIAVLLCPLNPQIGAVAVIGQGKCCNMMCGFELRLQWLSSAGEHHFLRGCRSPINLDSNAIPPCRIVPLVRAQMNRQAMVLFFTAKVHAYELSVLERE